jgi:methionyl-tRNA formyltransferase
MRIVLFGDGPIAAACLEELLALGCVVPLVVTYAARADADGPATAAPPPLAALAAARGCAVATPPDAEGRPLLDWVRGLRPDLVLSVYYAHRIPRPVRAAAPLGALNLHGALLPRARGRWAIPWVLLEGERESGVTLHEMSDELDAGDILLQRRFALSPRETATTLHARTVTEARAVLREALPLLRSGRAPRTPQDPGAATVVPPLLRRRDIDRTASVDRFDRTVRAFAPPYEGARVPCGGERVLVLAGEPGEGPGGIAIPLADGTYRVTRLGFEGEAPQDAAAFLARHPDAAEILGLPRE